MDAVLLRNLVLVSVLMNHCVCVEMSKMSCLLNYSVIAKVVYQITFELGLLVNTYKRTAAGRHDDLFVRNLAVMMSGYVISTYSLPAIVRLIRKVQPQSVNLLVTPSSQENSPWTRTKKR